MQGMCEMQIAKTSEFFLGLVERAEFYGKNFLEPSEEIIEI